MKKSISAGASVAVLMLGSSAFAATFAPVGGDTGPGILITISSTGVESITSTGQPPYDGAEDTQIGVVNNSSKTINSISLSSTTEDIFGFDGDGINAFTAVSNANDPSGYGGPLGSFIITDSTFGQEAGTVNFAGGIAPGASTYFSLEGPLTASSIGGGVPEPATWAMMLMGVFGVGAALRRVRRGAALLA
jgi:hypothetical protein